MFNKRSLLGVVVFLCLLLVPSEAFSKRLKPMIWDMDDLELMRTNWQNCKEAKQIVDEADIYCSAEHLNVVTNKVLAFTPDSHYYCSMGPYSWPDPNRIGHYITKDGLTNPDSKYYDSGKLNELSRRCYRLSQAFYITRDIKYFNSLVSQLKSWFLDDKTLMYPNFEYAQVIPNHNRNKGTSTGMIDGYFFNTIIESIRLLDYTKRIDRKTKKSLQEWFLSFADWSEERYGETMKNGNSNINLAYDVIIVNMYLFAGYPNKAKKIYDSFAERRIMGQILEDGSQPEELRRTRAFSYSLYNLTHILDFCKLANYRDKKYYAKNNTRIEKAFDFLQYYAESQESFPYKQITDWNDDLGGLKKQLIRLNKLKEN